jgi:hypothetical protein
MIRLTMIAVVVLASGCNLELGKMPNKPVVPERHSAPEVEGAPQQVTEARPAEPAPQETPAASSPEPNPQPQAGDKARWTSVIDLYEKISLELEEFAYGRIYASYNAGECQAYCEKMAARINDARQLVAARTFPNDVRLDVAGMHLVQMAEFSNPKHTTLGVNQRFDQFSRSKKSFVGEIQAVKLWMLDN